MTVDRLSVAIDMTHARLNRTGLGRYAAELEPALRARGAVDLIELLAADGALAGPAGRVARGLWRELAYYPATLARQARRAGADLVHAPTPAAVRGGGLPLVVTVHDLLPVRHPDLFTRETRAHTRLFMSFVRRATRVIAVSEATRHDVIELLGVAPDQVCTVLSGVAARFYPHEADRDRLRARFTVEAPYVLAVGTLEPRKNLVSVLRAFRGVSREVPEAQLVIAGGRGWRNERFQQELGSASDRVRLTGFVSDVELVELYAGASVFVFPSLAEGFGFPPLEAMACGTPVVTSDRSSLPEVVGDAGLLVDPTDPGAIAAAVVRVLGDSSLAADLRQRGRRRAAHLTWERTAARTEDVYRAATDSSYSPAARGK